ncbi:MAG TPA: glycosyl hydrolase [Streptosporangiaceae bacterium]
MTRRRRRRNRTLLAGVGVVLVLAVAIGLVVTRPWESGIPTGTPVPTVRYLGVSESDSPTSYAGTERFAQDIGGRPNVAIYYSQWPQPFQQRFAATAAAHGAATLVQLDPEHISLAAIADGRYDGYLRQFGGQIKAFGHRVVLSFGHEMNGYWYTWANTQTDPATFVRAWRHMVDVVRATGASNVTWLWTVNVVQTEQSPQIPDPRAWWPGPSYVDWVGIDGYYHSTSDTFSQVFGPTIVDVRRLTPAPILITETGAASSSVQQVAVKDVFAGVRTFGLLGFLWFDENKPGTRWHITSPQVFATFRQQAHRYYK